MKKGEIYLVDVDFIDSSESKVRPALILSNNSYNKQHPDVIICSVTTNSSHDCFLKIGETDLSSGRVYPGSGVRYDSVTRVDKARFGRGVGRVSADFHQAIIDKLLLLFS